MIPANANLMNLTFDFQEQPTKTYRMDLRTGKNIHGYTDELEAMKQVIFRIRNGISTLFIPGIMESN